MNKFFALKFMFILVFVYSTSLYSQTVTLVKNMDFGIKTQGVAATVVVAPTSSGAAVFNASGMTVNKTATCKITTTSVTLSNGGSGATNQITVNAFTINGCTTKVPASGQILNIGVGATATIAANDLEGDYSGTAIFRITTN